MKHEIINRNSNYYYEGTQCTVITQMPDNLQHIGTFNDYPAGNFQIYTILENPKAIFIKGKTLSGEIILTCTL